MQEEIFPLVDEQGIVVGQASRSVCHDGSKLLHPVIHLHIFNSKGELYLQKRSATKDVQPVSYTHLQAASTGNEKQNISIAVVLLIQPNLQGNTP